MRRTRAFKNPSPLLIAAIMAPEMIGPNRSSAERTQDPLTRKMTIEPHFTGGRSLL
jgi:hypothetical protein